MTFFQTINRPSKIEGYISEKLRAEALNQVNQTFSWEVWFKIRDFMMTHIQFGWLQLARRIKRGML